MRTFLTLLLSFSLLGLMACGDASDAEEDLDPGTDVEAPQGETSDLGMLYGQVNELNRQMSARYDEVSSELSPELRARHDSLQSLHSQLMRSYGHMSAMGDHSGGMMGGEAADSVRVRELDGRLQSLHEEMADLMEDEGHEELAEMHEQMTEHLERMAGMHR